MRPWPRAEGVMFMAGHLGAHSWLKPAAPKGSFGMVCRIHLEDRSDAAGGSDWTR